MQGGHHESIHAPPSTGSKRGGNCTEKAHICENSSGIPNECVQRRARKTLSSIHDDNYLSSESAIEPTPKKYCMGLASTEKCKVKKVNVNKQKRKSSNDGPKRMSRGMKKWLKLCFPKPTLENLAKGCPDLATTVSMPRRSSRLAARQKRIAHHRAQTMDKTRAKLCADKKEVLRTMEEESGKKR